MIETEHEVDVYFSKLISSVLAGVLILLLFLLLGVVFYNCHFNPDYYLYGQC